MKKIGIGLCLWLLFALACGASSIFELLPGISREKLPPVPSPDGRREARLSHKALRGWSFPAETEARWARLRVYKNGWRYYNSGDEPLSRYENDPGFAMDLAWSPDSSRLAYRQINSLRIIGANGKILARFSPSGKSVVSSFRWIDDASLLVVAKETVYPSDPEDGPPTYSGYTEEAEKIHVFRWTLADGDPVDLFQQNLRKTTFLFHSASFGVDEISPNVDRVAFSDGVDLCVYDLAANAVVARHPIPQIPTTPEFAPDADDFTKQIAIDMAAWPDQLDGIWWRSNDQLLVGVELLRRPKKRAFYAFDLPTQEWTDHTAVLLPVWENAFRNTPDYAGLDWFGWKDPNWYRSALP